MPPRVWSAKGKEKRTRLKQFCWPFLLSHARSQSFSRLSIPCRWHCTSLSWIKRVIRVVKYTKNFPRSVSVTFHDFLFAPRSLPFATIPKVFDQKKKKIKSFFHPCTMDAKLCFQHFQHLSYDVTRYPFAFMYFPVKMKIREKSQLETFAASLKAILIRFNKLFFCIFLYICICVVLYISFYYSLFRYNSIIIINIFELIFQPNIFTYNPMNCTRG